MADAPAVKLWGKDYKDYLQKLINQGKVDIINTANTDYINSVWHKHFWVHDNYNFYCNIRSYG
jgi:hypothetical protein